MPMTGPESSSRRALIRGCWLKQATRKASYFEAMGMIARIAAAEERTPSRWPSMADGAGCGDVKPVTVQCGGSVSWRERRQASVMDEVPFGFMRRILIVLVEVPVTDGSEIDSAIFRGRKGVVLMSRREIKDEKSKQSNE